MPSDVRRKCRPRRSQPFLPSEGNASKMIVRSSKCFQMFEVLCSYDVWRVAGNKLCGPDSRACLWRHSEKVDSLLSALSVFFSCKSYHDEMTQFSPWVLSHAQLKKKNTSTFKVIKAINDSLGAAPFDSGKCSKMALDVKGNLRQLWMDQNFKNAKAAEPSHLSLCRGVCSGFWESLVSVDVSKHDLEARFGFKYFWYAVLLFFDPPLTRVTRGY